MKKTVTEYEFINTIVGDEYNNMTREGAGALFDYIENMDLETGVETELDRVAIRTQWHEYEGIEVALEEYYHLGIKTLEDLEEWTTVIKVPETSHIIIAIF